MTSTIYCNIVMHLSVDRVLHDIHSFYLHLLFVQGEFVQTFKRNGFSFGLTMAAIEQVAQQGLACVTHTSIEVTPPPLSYITVY